MKNYECIITIVARGKGDLVIDASRESGAKGGTIIHGRGSGIHETRKVFGVAVQPEKEIVITLVKAEKLDNVINSITKELDLSSPGKGILFVLDVERVVGITQFDMQDSMLNLELDED
jgi:nitrogen regulatory protein PII